MRSTICCRRIRSGAHGFAAAVTTVAAMLMTGVASGADGRSPGERYVPASPDTVLVTLDANVAGVSLQDLRRRLQVSPDDATLAADFARAALRRYAVSGDPRWLGYADGALTPWSGVAAPPRELWLLRGRLRQTQHRFDSAALDLERFLERHPDSIEASMLAADARRRAGRLDQARDHCLRLHLSGRADLARACAADLLLTRGRAADAYEAAIAADAMAADVPAGADRAFTLSVLADAARADGRTATARDAYERAIAASQPAPLALSVSHVDLLLANGKVAAAERALAALPPADAVLLRRAILSARTGGRYFADARDELERRFAAADAGGPDRLHLRERAMFALHVQDDAAAAVALAVRNWQLQKGWEDAALLLQAAAIARDAAAADKVREWRAAMAGS